MPAGDEAIRSLPNVSAVANVDRPLPETAIVNDITIATNSGITTVFADCLGTAEWQYTTDNKSSATRFSVFSVAANDSNPLNLSFEHVFVSKKLSAEENKKFLDDLTSVLKTVNAENIVALIKDDSPIVQSIL